MSKPAFVEMAKRDMDAEAEWILSDLCNYAEKNLMSLNFIIDTFLQAFHKRVEEERSKE